MSNRMSLLKTYTAMFFLALGLLWPPPVKAMVTEIPFQGEWDIPNNKLEFLFDLGDKRSVSGNVTQLTADRYHLYLNVDHVKLFKYDYSSEIDAQIEVKRSNVPSEPYVSGTIASQYSLLNYKPVRDLEGQWAYHDKKIYIQDLSMGNVACQGTIDLAYPYSADLNVKLASVEMDDFLNFWVKSDINKQLAGLVSGDIKVMGTADRLYLKGSLESDQGQVGKLQFDSISLNIEGIYPYLNISRSMISETDGLSFNVEGPLALNDHENFAKQIKELNLSPVVNTSQDGSEWTLKETKEGMQTRAFKHIYHKDNSLPSEQENPDLIGFEKSMQF